MGRLVYSAIASLDGYIADADGKWDWSFPSTEVHAFVNDLMRPARTHLYGRRLYEVLVAWETMDDPAPEMQDYAQLWRAADKVVYSSTLDAVSTPRSSLHASFDPASVRRMLDDAERDVSVGGPTLAAAALRAGLVDEVQVYLHPVVIGGGLYYLPQGLPIALELLDSHRFEGGVVYLRYAISK